MAEDRLSGISDILLPPHFQAVPQDTGLAAAWLLLLLPLLWWAWRQWRREWRFRWQIGRLRRAVIRGDLAPREAANQLAGLQSRPLPSALRDGLLAARFSATSVTPDVLLALLREIGSTQRAGEARDG